MKAIYLLDMDTACGIFEVNVMVLDENADILFHVEPPSKVFSEISVPPETIQIEATEHDTAYKFVDVPDVSVSQDDPEFDVLKIDPPAPTM